MVDATKPPVEVSPDGAVSDRARTWLWWCHTFLELCFLFGLIVGIEYALGDGRVGSFKVYPHPYWLIVIPVAAARGVIAGLLASAVATGFYAMGAQQELRLPELTQLLSLDVMLDPVLFFGVGFIVGEFRDVIAAKMTRQTTLLDKARERTEALAKQRDVLQEANRLLEKRLVDNATQFGNLVATATRIEKANRRQVLDIALDLVEEHCGAFASVLVPLANGPVDLLCQRGWTEKEIPDRLGEARKSPYVARALSEGKDVDGFAMEEEPPETGPFLVAPLVGPRGVIEALLCMNEIPASRLNSSTVRTFFAISDWMSAVLSRMGRPAPAPAPVPAAEPEAEPGVVRRLRGPVEFARHLVVEYERATRYGSSLSVLTIQFLEWTDRSPEALARVDAFVLDHLETAVRPSDGVYDFPHPGCYVALLPGTSMEQAEAVKEALVKAVKAEEAAGFGHVRVKITGPDPRAPDAQDLVERIVDRFRTESIFPLSAKVPFSLPADFWVGNLDEFQRAIRSEVDLTYRDDETTFQVLSIWGSRTSGVDPGLLAFHVEQIAGTLLRRCDTIYAVGPCLVAVILPLTEEEDAWRIGERLVETLKERDPMSPWGKLTTNVLSFGTVFPDGNAFLEALSLTRPLANVDIAGRDR